MTPEHQHEFDRLLKADRRVQIISSIRSEPWLLFLLLTLAVVGPPILWEIMHG